MYFSRVWPQIEYLSSIQYREIFSGNMYAIHQLLWKLFPNCQNRHFLFREEEPRYSRDRLFYYLVSELPPKTDIKLFHINTEHYASHLVKGQKASFSLRVNPVVTKFRGKGLNGQRHDVLMDAKQAAEKNGQRNCWPFMHYAAIDWLNKRAGKLGFSIRPEQILMDNYSPHILKKKSQRESIQFSSVDFSGILQVEDPVILQKTLFQGVGRAKAFGCGLLLIQ